MTATIRSTLLICLALAPALAGAAVELETEDQKTIYALGLVLADNLGRYNLTEEEIRIVKAGLDDGIAGKAQVELEEYGPKLRELAMARAAATAEAEKAAATGFLAEMAAKPGAQVTESGLIFFDVEPGSGANPAATDTVSVHYTGTLRDGTVFDSSRERGEPATFPLNRVIACWTEGVQKIKVGGKARLVCPSGIAYGDRGAPPRIPPGAVLVFEVELLGIE